MELKTREPTLICKAEISLTAKTFVFCKYLVKNDGLMHAVIVKSCLIEWL